MRKNSHDRILREELKKQRLNIVSKFCPFLITSIILLKCMYVIIKEYHKLSTYISAPTVL